jgi:predicted O-methyltransferase YrrM
MVEQPARETKLEAKFERRRRFDTLCRECRLRELPAAALFDGILTRAVPLAAIKEETVHDNHAEMLYVIEIAAHRHSKRIFEFGTNFGRTTFHLASACPEAVVTTLDLPRAENPWPYAPFVGAYFEGTEASSRIRQIRVDSRRFDPTPYEGQMDFVWVDADHSYEGVKNDTEMAFRLLAPGGAIMWHDFGPDSPDLVRFFVEFTRTRPLFRIRKTSVLQHLDGVDPLTFVPAAVPFTKALFKPPKR